MEKMRKLSRIEREKRTVRRMIDLYCRLKEGNARRCAACDTLLAYACTRLNRCPFGENKPACQRCTVHCYKPAMRAKMREVMRFSGPRMLFHYPLDALRHLCANLFSLKGNATTPPRGKNEI